MPIDLVTFVKDLRPDSTVLFFGAGSSIPSHAPSVANIIDHLSSTFRQPPGFTLTELADLIELKTKDRQRLIKEVRNLFANLRPTGGFLNIPLYDWKAIYTTNYDELIEEAYRQRDKSLIVYSSNFDFTVRGKSAATKLFKLHGTISKDISDGNVARLVLSGTDYNYVNDYRDKIFDRFKADLGDSDVLIIGHSLADQDVKDAVNRAIKLNSEAYSGNRITLLMYEQDSDRAALFEGKGLRVVFGSIDAFTAELARNAPDHVLIAKISDDPLDKQAALRPVTIDVSYEIERAAADISKMFNGWAASYADVAAGLTFERTLIDEVDQFFRANDALCAVIVGASGVGKTTAARQIIYRFRGEHLCWEHNGDHSLQADDWIAVARDLAESGKRGVIFVDDAHTHIHELSDLIDGLVRERLASLKVLAASSRNNWRPRVKTPNLFKAGKEFHLSRLDNDEIEKLLTLVETKEVVHRLIENTFAGFSRHEKRRRLVERCEADMFVCMKNIFASENFDDIILREYAELPGRYQDIYRLIAALESAGVRVHRQLVIRLLGIPAAAISAVLEGLMDIVTEHTVSSKEHIYVWSGRHPVINAIITKYKFSEPNKIFDLFDKVIENINPTYDIEIRSIRELCNVEYGIARIPDKKVQNRLLRKMVSVAPGERVPRHRLIRNLIELGEFDQAQTEIRIFDKDFRSDGPVARYKINLMVARGVRTDGIMLEDRRVILEEARNEAVAAIRKFPYNPQVFTAYCEVGVEYYRLTGRMDIFTDAIAALKEAEIRIGDPQVTTKIRQFERRFAGILSSAAPAENEPKLPGG